MILRSAIATLAENFASEVLNAIRSTPLEELLSEDGSPRSTKVRATANASGNGSAPRSNGRLPRRSTTEIGGMVSKIVSLLEKAPEGLRAEQLRSALGVQAKEMPRPLKEALAAGRVRTKGQKRATTYFLKNGAGKTAARTSKKSKKKG